jgi:hypothetical protein
MRDMWFFHDIKKDVGCRITCDEGSVEEFEVSPLRQATGATFIFFIADKGRRLRYLFKNPIQFNRRSRAKYIDVDGQPANHRDMEQKARTPLEDELQVAFRQMPQERKGMEPFRASRDLRL